MQGYQQSAAVLTAVPALQATTCCMETACTCVANSSIIQELNQQWLEN
jgi:hypothetical protein